MVVDILLTECVPSGLSPVSATPLTRYHSALVLSQEGKHGVHRHDRISTSLERPANDKMSGMQKRQYHMQPKRDIHASGPLNPSYDPWIEIASMSRQDIAKTFEVV